MPRGAKIDDEIGGHEVLPDTSATVTTIHAERKNTTAELRAYLDKLHDRQASIDNIMSAAGGDCQPFVDDMKAIKKEAAENGFAKKILATHFKEERLDIKKRNVANGLNAEQRETYQQQKIALGQLAGTPLGDAAVAGSA